MDKNILFNCQKLSLEIYQCQYCNFTTNIGISFCYNFQKLHATNKKHLFKSVDECYLCENCSFSTFSLLILLKHNLHCQDNTNKKRQLNIAKYQCLYCSYKTAYKNVFKDHVIYKHTAAEKIKWYKCNKCDYKGETKRSLIQHIIRRHKPVNNVLSYYCNLCEFKCKKKANLDRHILLKHTAPEKIKWCKCDICDYKGKTKAHLMEHIKNRHKLKEQVLLYCYHCEFKSRLKGNLKRHIRVKHTAPENAPKYKCNICDYKTIEKGYLKKHLIRYHNGSNQIQWYHCKHCTYRSKINMYLTQHVKEKHMLKEENEKLFSSETLESIFEDNASMNKTIFKEDIKKHIMNAIQFQDRYGGTSVV